MKFSERIALAALHKTDPETAHGLAIKALAMGLGPRHGPFSTARIKTSVGGLELPNPVGLAAGFDKNAEVVPALLKAGFGFVEVGAATPKAQNGNRKPRLFRLTEDRAAINRFGFNNEGMDVIAARLANRPNSGVVGINLGANKDSSHRAIDFVQVLETCGPHVDFATVNVSSPNTEKLRDLQGEKALTALLEGVMKTSAGLERPVPIFLKIAPDLTLEEIAQIAQVARHARLDAIIATNTTLDRDGLTSEHRIQKGGLSGAPLFSKSTQVLARLSAELEGHVPLIGVGGIASAEDAFEKIRAGASAVQLYTAMVFQGVSLANDIAKGLDRLLEQHGYNHISQAVGSGTEEFL
ncbi:dihydroorotate dehydrogenase (quinone) [Amylibacter marinus]|uniref:Dihydroorotate dehydrogenase (quinone) n=1 Tax=Amylibacter marinus TaxID=1475483 RepID=A0ABQ5VUQ4_9RHOB|nr:quinone-dependent dihydroorotate dehydrogenase [Amylibacter marinus]GLQ34953.1 dihydroorotate dehydrogenase (quinone) [Amylibacter marinus]